MPFHEMRSPRVYIPNKSYHDFSDAKRFGTLVFLTEGEQNRFKINDMYRRIMPLMADAMPGDYLLISGPTTINVVAASILAHKFGRINYLVYDGYLGQYTSRPVVLNQTEDGDGRAIPEHSGAEQRGSKD